MTSIFTLRGRRGTIGDISLCVAGVALTALGGLWWRTGFSADAALCVAGVALGDIDFQAWHLRHWAGSGGAPGSQLTPWAPRLFAWQAWHLVTLAFNLRSRRGTRSISSITLRGRRGTYGTERALVAHRVLS